MGQTLAGLCHLSVRQGGPGTRRSKHKTELIQVLGLQKLPFASAPHQRTMPRSVLLEGSRQVHLCVAATPCLMLVRHSQKGPPAIHTLAGHILPLLGMNLVITFWGGFRKWTESRLGVQAQSQDQ